MSRIIPLKTDLKNTVTAMDLAEGIGKVYSSGLQKGDKTGWANLDKHYSVSPGQWTLVTGIPGHGKSEFLDALMVNLATNHDWRFAVFSPENTPIELHIAKLLEKRIGKPFFPGPTPRMTEEDIAAHSGWMDTHFGFIANNEQPLSIDAVLEDCYGWAMMEPGKRTGIIVDPWNELEHMRPAGLSESEYISQTLSTVRRFARHCGAHVWLVAHPAKLMRDKDGKRPIPTPYDVSGSAHWYNKADNAICVWRDPNDSDVLTQIHVQKVRFKQNGRVGSVELQYDKITGRYHVPLRESSKAYRDAAEGE